MTQVSNFFLYILYFTVLCELLQECRLNFSISTALIHFQTIQMHSYETSCLTMRGNATWQFQFIYILFLLYLITVFSYSFGLSLDIPIFTGKLLCWAIFWSFHDFFVIQKNLCRWSLGRLFWKILQFPRKYQWWGPF